MTEQGGEDRDRHFMRRAIELAERGLGRVAPNPLVGAVVVRDGQVVGEGWHREFGSAHAEVEALAAAGDLARDATLYVSLEPCAHHGKTAPCTDAILAAGVRRVVFALADPDPLARGGGEVLAAAGVEVREGVEQEAARALNRAFLRVRDPGGPRRPWLELKLALSLDGRIADPSGRSNWITGEEARAEVHRLRAAHDAIAVGIGTVLSDDPLLTVRGDVIPRRPPVRLVFDRQLRVPLTSRLLTSITEVPVWVVGASAAPEERRHRLEELGARVIAGDDLPTSLGILRELGINSIVCEGGAQLASSLLAADLVDRLTLFMAPLLLGADGADPFRAVGSRPLEKAPRWTPIRRATFGDDTLLSFDRIE